MLPRQSEMNGPIVDSEATLNPTYDVSACCASLRSPGMGGVTKESDFRAIRHRLQFSSFSQ
jgi:hypothetical protein